MRGPLALIAMLLVAGCAMPGSPLDAGTTATRAGSFESVSLETCVSQFDICFEPSIATDGAGRVAVSSGTGANIAISEDDGLTWREVAPPPGPPGLPMRTHVTDSTVYFAPHGALYYTGIVVESWPKQTGLFGFLPLGIQVAASEDLGVSWSVNTLVGWSLAPGEPVLGTDRPFLAFGPDGDVYLQYNEISQPLFFLVPVFVESMIGPRVARSEDGGLTWSAFTRVTPMGRAKGGPPVVDDDGTLSLPYYVFQGPEAGVYVASSADRGVTWTSTRVRTSEDIGWFAVATPARDGIRHMGWYEVSGEGGAIWWSSTSGAGDWTEPRIVSLPGESTPIGPWVDWLPDGRVGATYFTETPDGDPSSGHLWLLTGMEGEETQRERIFENLTFVGRGGGTDLPAFARTSSGVGIVAATGNMAPGQSSILYAHRAMAAAE